MSFLIAMLLGIKNGGLRMQDNKIIERIQKALEWYELHHSKADIHKLLVFQDKLSLLSCNLAEMVAKSKGSAVGAYFERKYVFSVNKMSFINSKEGVGKAETMAETSIKAEREREVAALEYSEGLRLLLSQLNRVLSSCQQRISFAKSEWDRLHKMSHDNTK